MAQVSEDRDGGASFEARTPMGTITGRNLRSMDLFLMAVVTAVTGVIIGFSYFIGAKVDALTGSMRQFAIAQREMACIISIPMERREEQFMDPSSFCRRVAREGVGAM